MTDDDSLKKVAKAVLKLQEPYGPPRLPEATETPESSEIVRPDAEETEIQPGDAAPSAFGVEVPDVEGPGIEGPYVEEPYVEWPDAEIAEVAPAEPARKHRRISPRSPRQAIEPEMAPPPPARFILKFFLNLSGILIKPTPLLFPFLISELIFIILYITVT